MALSLVTIKRRVGVTHHRVLPCSDFPPAHLERAIAASKPHIDLYQFRLEHTPNTYHKKVLSYWLSNMALYLKGFTIATYINAYKILRKENIAPMYRSDLANEVEAVIRSYTNVSITFQPAI